MRALTSLSSFAHFGLTITNKSKNLGVNEQAFTDLANAVCLLESDENFEKAAIECEKIYQKKLDRTSGLELEFQVDNFADDVRRVRFCIQPEKDETQDFFSQSQINLVEEKGVLAKKTLEILKNFVDNLTDKKDFKADDIVKVIKKFKDDGGNWYQPETYFKIKFIPGQDSLGDGEYFVYLCDEEGNIRENKYGIVKLTGQNVEKIR